MKFKIFFFEQIHKKGWKKKKKKNKNKNKNKKILPDRESNPGLPRDRRGFCQLYYRG